MMVFSGRFSWKIPSIKPANSMGKSHRRRISASTSMKIVNVGLKILGTSLCIICFLALCWEQLLAYLQRNKGLSQQLVKVDDRKFPVIVICLDEAYLSKDSDILDEDEYEKNLRNFSVELKGRIVTDYTFTPIKEYKQSHLDTYYHGRCQVFHIDESFVPLEAIGFWMSPRDAKYLVYFFEDGEEKTLTMEIFFNPVSMTRVGESINGILRTETLTQLDEVIACKDIDFQEFFSCLHEEALVQMAAKNLTCGNHLMRNIGLDLPDCKTGEEFWDLIAVVYKTWVDAYEIEQVSGGIFKKANAKKKDGKTAKTCTRPCTSRKFDLQDTPMSYLNEEKMNSRAFYVAFASSFDLESREYLLFDFARITAAVGGAMGLFLGVSLFQAILFITEKLSGSGYKVQVDEAGSGTKSDFVKVMPAQRPHIISIPE